MTSCYIRCTSPSHLPFPGFNTSRPALWYTGSVSPVDLFADILGISDKYTNIWGRIRFQARSSETLCTGVYTSSQTGQWEWMATDLGEVWHNAARHNSPTQEACLQLCEGYSGLPVCNVLDVPAATAASCTRSPTPAHQPQRQRNL
jgi:hypothetical protein